MVLSVLQSSPPFSQSATPMGSMAEMGMKPRCTKCGHQRWERQCLAHLSPLSASLPGHHPGNASLYPELRFSFEETLRALISGRVLLPEGKENL